DDTERRTMGDILAVADEMLAEGSAHGNALVELHSTIPGMGKEVHAMLVLSMVDEPLVNPIFSRTDAIGTVMRRNLKPVFEPLQRQLDILRNRSGR
ncbi:MAG: hypothetical protein WA970_25515, partial [Gammaproteobacteria bacterium]